MLREGRGGSECHTDARGPEEPKQLSALDMYGASTECVLEAIFERECRATRDKGLNAATHLLQYLPPTKVTSQHAG